LLSFKELYQQQLNTRKMTGLNYYRNWSVWLCITHGRRWVYSVDHVNAGDARDSW